MCSHRNYLIQFYIARNFWVYRMATKHKGLSWGKAEYYYAPGARIAQSATLRWMFKILSLSSPSEDFYYLVIDYNEILIHYKYCNQYYLTLLAYVHTVNNTQSSPFHVKWTHKVVIFNPTPSHYIKILWPCRPCRNEWKCQTLALYTS